MENNLVRHLLLVQFRAGMTDETFQTFIGTFRELCRKIEGIVAFEYGTNNSPEGRNHGLTHVITLTFGGVRERDAYLPHPEHLQFAEWVNKLDIVEDLLVIDYVPQN